MARTRLIHPGASIEEDVAVMSIAARLLWAYLPCHADREGRMKDSPFSIKAAVFPADSVDVNALLEELASARHIIRYQSDGRRIIQIRNFRKYQSPHKNESDSMFPAPPNHENSRVVVNNHERSLPSVSGSGDGSGDGSGEPDRSASPPGGIAPVYPAAFEEVWEKTGKRGSKFKALKAWKHAERPPWSVVSIAWGQYMASADPVRGFVQHLATWLNGRGHLQEWAPGGTARGSPSGARPPSTATRDAFANLLSKANP